MGEESGCLPGLEAGVRGWIWLGRPSGGVAVPPLWSSCSSDRVLSLCVTGDGSCDFVIFVLGLRSFCFCGLGGGELCSCCADRRCDLRGFLMSEPFSLAEFYVGGQSVCYLRMRSRGAYPVALQLALLLHGGHVSGGQISRRATAQSRESDLCEGDAMIDNQGYK